MFARRHRIVRLSVAGALDTRFGQLWVQSAKCRAINRMSVKRRKADLSCPAWALLPSEPLSSTASANVQSDEDQPKSAVRTRALGDAFELLTAQRSRAARAHH